LKEDNAAATRKESSNVSSVAATTTTGQLHFVCVNAYKPVEDLKHETFHVISC
jgi:hypothetical protein